MKQFSFIFIVIITVLFCTGCVSSAINDAVALIEREANAEANSANYRAINESVLSSIQALRNSQKVAKQANFPIESQAESSISTPSDKQSYTFAYDSDNKELNYHDKITIISLVVNKNKSFIINIAPAKGKNTLDQLALSMARAEVLRLYISRFNSRISINFDPKLSTDTINLVTGV